MLKIYITIVEYSLLTLTTIWFVTRCKKRHLPGRTDANLSINGDITMLVYLHESVTNTNYNGIVRSEHDLKVLIQNFTTMIKEQYGLDSDKLHITYA